MLHATLSRVVAERSPGRRVSDACPMETVYYDGRVPCTLPRGHAEPHAYGDTVLPFADEMETAPRAAGTEG